MKRISLVLIVFFICLITIPVLGAEVLNVQVTDITSNATTNVNIIDNSTPKDTNMFGLTQSQVISITYPACIFGLVFAILYVIYLILKKKFILPRKGYTEEVFQRKKYRINSRIVYMLILSAIFIYYLLINGQA